jgi:hypothetical protein
MNVGNRKAEAATMMAEKIFDCIPEGILAGDWSLEKIHFELTDYTNCVFRWVYGEGNRLPRTSTQESPGGKTFEGLAIRGASSGHSRRAIAPGHAAARYQRFCRPLWCFAWNSG